MYWITPTGDLVMMQDGQLVVCKQMVVASANTDVPEPAEKVTRHYKKREGILPAPSGANKKGPRQPCSECESIGTRHFKTCSKFSELSYAVRKDGEKGVTHDDGTPTLNKESWDDIKDSYNDGMSMETIRLGYPAHNVADLRVAVGFDTYAEYRKSINI